MRLLELCWRGLLFHRRGYAAVFLGVLAGTAVLAGALVVGDSMRASLKELALGRLGRVDHALVAQRFFRTELAGELTEDEEFSGRFSEAVSLVVMQGAVTRAQSESRVNKINVYGVDAGFWALDDALAEGEHDELVEKLSSRRSVVLNDALARELGAVEGGTVLLRLEKVTSVHRETVLGRKDETALTLRLKVAAIIPSRGLGAFGLNPGQAAPRNAYLELTQLQKALGREGRANAIWVAEREGDTEGEASGAILDAALARRLTLGDLELELRTEEELGYVALESERLLLEPAVEAVSLESLDGLGVKTFPVYTYLANSMTIVGRSGDGDPRESSEAIPYSTVTAVDLKRKLPGTEFVGREGEPIASLAPGTIVLNEWAAEDLGAKVGERIEMVYFVEGAGGKLITRRSEFDLTAICALEGLGLDPGLAPEVQGMTDVSDISDWDSPFPVDLGLIRDKDEDYWDEHRTTPKAFLNLGEAQGFWSGEENRFGRLTSIQAAPKDEESLNALAARIQEDLEARLEPSEFGLVFEAVRENALQASRGATDFSGLFVGFSFFIIFSAALLVALLFRLGVERRAKEVGTLRAIGFSDGMILKVFLGEGAFVSVLGSLAGVAGSILFASLMLNYLRSTWSETMAAGFLTVHASSGSLAIGGISGFGVALISIALGLRGFKKLTPRALLAGAVSSGRGGSAKRVKGKIAPWLCGICLVAAAVLAGVGVMGVVSSAGVFFGVGSSLLVGLLAGLLLWVRGGARGRIGGSGLGAMMGIGLRNATVKPRRTLTTAGLVASASFVLIAVGAFRQGGDHDPLDRASGTGGFVLLAESTLPLYQDLSTSEGREELGLGEDVIRLLTEGSIQPLRLSDGDEASCLNLYQPGTPRLVGVPPAMRDRGGFSFTKSMADSEDEKENPWNLLTRTFEDGAIPAIGDANAVQYQLKSGLGKDLEVFDEGGNPVRLRFVGLLAGSVLQGEVLVAEENFIPLFPGVSGYRFFLMECPVADAQALSNGLEKELGKYGFDVVPTGDRLAEYHAIENTYLSTFQILGGLGLLLGTLGLATVVLRNVLERRGEYALMRAVGYRKNQLGLMVLAENGVLLGVGLGIGAGSALLAISPQLFQGPSDVSWGTLLLSVVAVFLTGMAAGSVAVFSTVGAPLIPALRSE